MSDVHFIFVSTGWMLIGICAGFVVVGLLRIMEVLHRRPR